MGKRVWDFTIKIEEWERLLKKHFLIPERKVLEDVLEAA
jgi:hypothetical protein